MDKERKVPVSYPLVAVLGFLLLLFTYMRVSPPAVASPSIDVVTPVNTELFLQGSVSLPPRGYGHQRGDEYIFSGTLSSNVPLRSCRIELWPRFGEGLISAVIYPQGTDACSIDLSSLNSLVKLSDLSPGEYRYRLLTTDKDGQVYPSARSHFYVMDKEWAQLSKERFYDSYEETLAFFQGNDSAFLYAYQPVWDKYILPDPSWAEEYIVPLPAYPEGSYWEVHKDAQGAFEQVLHSLSHTYVRIEGTMGDSGILPLSALIQSTDGSFVPAFTSDKGFISFHALGLAVDLNASMTANHYTAENQALLRREIEEKLVYNGLWKENGQAYHSFSYSGDYPLLYRGVPETVVNYLLYDLAFYPAGFRWGHYYQGASDGMHFMLAETVAIDHGGMGGLRKVYAYE